MSESAFETEENLSKRKDTLQVGLFELLILELFRRHLCMWLLAGAPDLGSVPSN